MIVCSAHSGKRRCSAFVPLSVCTEMNPDIGEVLAFDGAHDSVGDSGSAIGKKVSAIDGGRCVMTLCRIENSEIGFEGVNYLGEYLVFVPIEDRIYEYALAVTAYAARSVTIKTADGRYLGKFEGLKASILEHNEHC